MAPHDFIQLLVELAVMLACALVGGSLMRRIRQPAVLGEMLAGIALGPTVFGALAPQWQGALFADAGSVATVRDAVIKLGMLFFLFIVGLQIDLRRLRQHTRAVLLIGLAGTLVPLAAGIALVYAVPEEWLPREVPRLPLALFLGTTMANTANPVLARILMDLGLFEKDLGAILMASTIFDDLLCWSLVAVVLANINGEPLTASGAVGSAGLVAALLIASLVAGRFAAVPLLDWARRGVWPTSFIGAAIVLVLASAAVAEYVGVHAFLGPFLLGLAIVPGADDRREAYEVLHQFALSFFVPVYFVSLGLAGDFFSDFDLRWGAAILAIACASKIVSVFAAARLAGFDSRHALAIGLGMNARGATGIILASVGLQYGVIDSQIYVALIVTSLVTSLAAGPLVQWTLRLRHVARDTAPRR